MRTYHVTAARRGIPGKTVVAKGWEVKQNGVLAFSGENGEFVAMFGPQSWHSVTDIT